MKKNLFAVALASAALLVSCSGGNKKGITKGDLSEMDTLSYAMGLDLSSNLSMSFSDVPLDYKALNEGLEDGAFKETKHPQEELAQTVQTYMSIKRNERKAAILKKREQQDSIRIANGDTVKVEYPKADPEMFESEKERTDFAYALGANIGASMASMRLPLQLAWIEEAMQNKFDNNPKMTEQDAQNFLRTYFTVTLPEANAAASKKFMEKIEGKSGVKKTQSGLLYQIVEEGNMTVVAKDSRDKVKVHYKGSLNDGTVFDASHFKDMPEERQAWIKKNQPDLVEKDEPAEFAVGQVIPGWSEGIRLIGKGGKIKLWIPAELAYGAQGAGRAIGPNEALEFEVELLDVTPFIVDPESEEGKNMAESKKWFEEVAKMEGIQKTESGIYYQITKEGDMAVKATDDRDKVKVHYKGMTRTGKVFDASRFADRSKEQQEMIKKYRKENYDKDEPVEFALNQVIKGWTEGLKLIGKGGSIKLWIPTELAYGSRGAGQDIRPGEALLFEVDLIDVIPFEE